MIVYHIALFSIVEQSRKKSKQQKKMFFIEQLTQFDESLIENNNTFLKS